MKIILNLLNFIFPSSLISSHSLKNKFRKRDNNSFRISWIIASAFGVIAYIGHYYLVDLPLGKEPIKLWFNYRFGIAAYCFINFIYYFSNKNTHLSSYKVFGLGLSLTICYLQSRTNVWHPEVPYTYTFLLIIIFGFLLKLSTWQYLVKCMILLPFVCLNLKQAGVTHQELISGAFLTLFFGCVLSSIKYFQIKIFDATENLLFEQQKNIEQNIKYSQKLKSFLPMVIVNRLEDKINNHGESIDVAMNSVLSPKNINIACLSCDIRSYTEKSKSNLPYILDSVLPLTISETKIVEENQGIPRKIGDMLFCYFDGKLIFDNIRNALITGIKISRNESSYNKNKDDENKVEKHIIVSCGESIVGNIGGQGSAIEVTALGEPVNYLNRLENVVKNPLVKNHINKSDIFLSQKMYAILLKMEIDIDIKEYSMNKLKLEIRNFENENYFYSIQSTEENLHKLINWTHNTQEVKNVS